MSTVFFSPSMREVPSYEKPVELGELTAEKRISEIFSSTLIELKEMGSSALPLYTPYHISIGAEKSDYTSLVDLSLFLGLCISKLEKEGSKFKEVLIGKDRETAQRYTYDQYLKQLREKKST
jgi:hypothetical protein